MSQKPKESVTSLLSLDHRASLMRLNIELNRLADAKEEYDVADIMLFARMAEDLHLFLYQANDI